MATGSSKNPGLLNSEWDSTGLQQQLEVAAQVHRSTDPA